MNRTKRKWERVIADQIGRDLKIDENSPALSPDRDVAAPKKEVKRRQNLNFERDNKAIVRHSVKRLGAERQTRQRTNNNNFMITT